MDEEWRDVPGFEDDYEVSSLGRVRTKPKILKPWLNAQTGYLQIKLGRKGRTTIHRLVCETFHGPQPNDDQCQVAHGDGCRTNNKIGNLRWASRRENGQDAIRHGTSPLIQYRGGSHRGEKHPMARLNAVQINQIRSRAIAGEKKQTLAAEFNISRTHLWRILNRRAWPPGDVDAQSVGQ